MSHDRFVLGALSKHSTSSFVLLLLAACAAPAPPLPERVPEPPYELVINAAVDSALDDLLMQMQRLPAFAPRPNPDVAEASSGLGKKEQEVPASRIVIAVDRSVGKSKQYSVASEVLDSTLLQSAGQKLAPNEVVAVSPPVLNRVQYLLAGTLTPLDAISTSRGEFRLNLSLTDFKTSAIVAQCSVRFNAEGVDLRPMGSGISH
jgi:hypothetical protein